MYSHGKTEATGLRTKCTDISVKDKIIIYSKLKTPFCKLCVSLRLVGELALKAYFVISTKDKKLNVAVNTCSLRPLIIYMHLLHLTHISKKG